MGLHSRIVLVTGNFQTSKMKFFVVFAAFVCIAYANTVKDDVKEKAVEEKAFDALKALEDPLFSKTKTEYDQETDNEKKTKIVDDFVKKVVGLETADQDKLKNLIKDNPILIDNLTDAKTAATATDLKTKMDANANLKKALEWIAKSDLAANSASAIWMSGLMVVSVVSLFLLH